MAIPSTHCTRSGRIALQDRLGGPRSGEDKTSVCTVCWCWELNPSRSLRRKSLPRPVFPSSVLKKNQIKCFLVEGRPLSYTLTHDYELLCKMGRTRNNRIGH